MKYQHMTRFANKWKIEMFLVKIILLLLNIFIYVSANFECDITVEQVFIFYCLIDFASVFLISLQINLSYLNYDSYLILSKNQKMVEIKIIVYSMRRTDCGWTDNVGANISLQGWKRLILFVNYAKRLCASNYNRIWRTCRRRPSRGTWDSSLPGKPPRSCPYRASWKSCPLPLPFRRSKVESSSTTRHVTPIRFLSRKQTSWTTRIWYEESDVYILFYLIILYYRVFNLFEYSFSLCFILVLCLNDRSYIAPLFWSCTQYTFLV